jgi:hypothetical protein
MEAHQFGRIREGLIAAGMEAGTPILNTGNGYVLIRVRGSFSGVATQGLRRAELSEEGEEETIETAGVLAGTAAFRMALQHARFFIEVDAAVTPFRERRDRGRGGGSDRSIRLQIEAALLVGINALFSGDAVGVTASHLQYRGEGIQVESITQLNAVYRVRF